MASPAFSITARHGSSDKTINHCSANFACRFFLSSQSTRRYRPGAVASSIGILFVGLVLGAGLVYALGFAGGVPQVSTTTITSTIALPIVTLTSTTTTHVTTATRVASTTSQTTPTTTRSTTSTTPTTSTSKSGDVTVTQIAVQLVVQVRFLNINVSKQNFNMTVSGFQTVAGSVENYTYTFQNTTGVSGTVVFNSVSVTTQGFSIISVTPALPIQLTLTPSTDVSITLGIQTPRAGYSGPLGILVMATYG